MSGFDNNPEIRAARAVMEAHRVALNACDEVALAATLHFPHIRLSEGQFTTWDSPATYFADFRARAGREWGSTEWGHVRPLQHGADKVHLDVRIDRFRPDGTPLTSFTSLWVIAQLGGVWGAQFRSSFALDSVLSG